MKQTHRYPYILFSIPMLVAVIFMLVGSTVSLHRPVAQAAPPPAPAAERRSYAPFAIPVTVSLPQGRGSVSLSIGVAYQHDAGAALSTALAARDDLVPALITRVVLDTAAQHPDAALQSHLAPALLAAFNSELTKLDLPAAVLEVFITSWAATW